VPPSTGPAVRALAPGHTARTAQAQPVLLWHLPRPLPSGGRLSFSLSPAGARAPDVETELARPRGAGIQSISTADFGVSLAERREYRWEVRYDGAGARALTEAWIERVPARGGLPADPVERAEARRLVSWFLDKMGAEVTDYLVTEKVYKRRMPTEEGGGPPDPAAIRAARSNIRYHLRYIGYMTARHNGLAGRELTFADLAAGAALSVVDYMGEVPWEENAGAKAWYARIKSRPSFRPLLADRLPGVRPVDHYDDLDF